MNREAEGTDRAALPSVNALMERRGLVHIAERQGRTAAVAAARAALEELRGELGGDGRTAAAAENGADGREALAARAEELARRHARRARRSTLRRVINATGVLVHTNLGRSPLSRAALEAAARAARGYVALEIDLATGTRGSRSVHCEGLLRELTGAEGALVVNNNAAALLLAVNTAAAGRAAIVSRGELVEIGGGFRVHEILARSGARLVEVGSTNRTHPADYVRALDELGTQAGAILKVHRSNFVQSGFVAEVSARALVDLVRDRGGGIPVIHDLGSGCLVDLSRYGVAREPTLGEAVADGPAFVTASGDKLLGGPQAGIVLGEATWIARARTNPLTRALRVDKLTLAALEATLRVHRDPARADRLPLFAMLARPVEELRRSAARLAQDLSGVPGVTAEVVETEARIGGGSLPGAAVESAGVALSLRGTGAAELEERLRRAPTPVVARVVEDRVVVDLRAVADDELVLLRRMLTTVLADTGDRGRGAG
ncbi:MAG TPA: L-seryl-tRNA(Sec) selenium transferase [Gemmatimonadota bacterium]